MSLFSWLQGKRICLDKWYRHCYHEETYFGAEWGGICQKKQYRQRDRCCRCGATKQQESYGGY